MGDEKRFPAPAVLCFLALAAACGGEWSGTAGTEPAVVARDAVLPAGGELRIAWEREGGVEADAWLDLTLVANDHRHAMTAAPQRLRRGAAGGECSIPLVPGAWAGDPLTDDLCAAILRIEARVSAGRARLRIGTAAGRSAQPLLRQPLLVDRGAWRELRVRLIDAAAGGLPLATGAAEVIDAGERSWPAFADQPGRRDGLGRWRPDGDPRWTVRLRPDEAPAAPLRLRWNGWLSPPFAWPATASGEPIPAVEPLAWPASPAAAGRCAQAIPGEAPRFAIIASDLPAAAAPILRWGEGWTGFRGPALTAWPAAQAWDAALIGAEEIDLLPQALAEERSAFRFGTSPWRSGIGGPWRTPADLFADDRPWRTWAEHARDVVARSRAAPRLARWRLGLVEPVAAADVPRLRAALHALAAQVGAADRRPVAILHPQARDYAKEEPRTQGWFDFAAGAQGWRGLAMAGGALAASADDGGQLRLTLPAVGAQRHVAAMVPLDANLHNLDRLEFQARLDARAGASVRLIAFCTDERHRWYQQDLGDLPAWGRWRTVGVDWSDGAAWQPSGHDLAWMGGASRRRVRSFGIAAWYHGPEGGPAAVSLAGFRRRGWPVLAADVASAPRIIELAGDGAESGEPPSVPRWQPISLAFRLDRHPANPYDPDLADVACEIDGPGGARTWPAYWAEPYDLVASPRGERAVPRAEAGSWRWSFAPPAPGIWRFRVVARLKERDAWTQIASAWRSVRVEPTGSGLPPVRPSAGDPRWFERLDGGFFYPIGINLRSPGDTVQEPLVQEVDGGRGARAAERDGTAAYARWFDRMRAQRMNWARVWMSPWWCGIEWTRAWDEFGGLGWYSQANAARLDRLLDLAAERGIYLQIELQNHGMTSPIRRRDGRAGVDSQWRDSPYAVENGGMCGHASEFYTEDAAWRMHAKRLRYTVARWGARSNIAAWVLTSETEFTGCWDVEAGEYGSGNSPGMQAWVERSLAWFAANDAYPRAVTIHFSKPWIGGPLWKTKGLGFGYFNAYTGFQSDLSVDYLGATRGRNLPLALWEGYHRYFDPVRDGRPSLLGEWGGHWNDNDHRRMSAELRTGVWFQAVLPYGGNTGFWWWLWLDAADAWGRYGAVARFLDGEDPRGRDFHPIKPTRDAPGDGRIIGMQGRDRFRLYAWLTGLDQDLGRRDARDQGSALLDTGLPGSRWRVERWECETGSVAARSELTADAAGRLRLPLGALKPDAAFKLDRIAADAPADAHGKPATR